LGGPWSETGGLQEAKRGDAKGTKIAENKHIRGGLGEAPKKLRPQLQLVEV